MSPGQYSNGSLQMGALARRVGSSEGPALMVVWGLAVGGVGAESAYDVP